MTRGQGYSAASAPGGATFSSRSAANTTTPATTSGRHRREGSRRQDSGNRIASRNPPTAFPVTMLRRRCPADSRSPAAAKVNIADSQNASTAHIRPPAHISHAVAGRARWASRNAPTTGNVSPAARSGVAGCSGRHPGGQVETEHEAEDGEPHREDRRRDGGEPQRGLQQLATREVAGQAGPSSVTVTASTTCLGTPPVPPSVRPRSGWPRAHHYLPTSPRVCPARTRTR